MLCRQVRYSVLQVGELRCLRYALLLVNSSWWQSDILDLGFCGAGTTLSPSPAICMLKAAYAMCQVSMRGQTDNLAVKHNNDDMLDMPV